MKTRTYALLATAAIASIVHGQANLVTRESNIHYSYVYGGGPFVYQDDQLLTDTTPMLTDTESFQYDRSESGTYLSHTWMGGAKFDVTHAFTFDGPLTDFHRLDWSGRTEVATVAGGDIGTAGAYCTNPGNEFNAYFDVASTTDFQLSGLLAMDRPGNTSYIHLQKFNGFNWEYVFMSYTLPDYKGPFSVNGTLVPGNYRIISSLYGSAFGNDSSIESGNFSLRLAQKSAPTSVTTRFGAINSGTVANLSTTDGSALRICKAFVPNITVAPIDVDLVGATSLSSVSALTYHHTSKMANAGSYQQTLTLFDYAHNAYSATATRTDPINTTYTMKTLSVTSNPTDFVGAGGALKARCQIRQTGFAAVAVPCTDIDEAGWSVMP